MTIWYYKEDVSSFFVPKKVPVWNKWRDNQGAIDSPRVTWK